MPPVIHCGYTPEQAVGIAALFLFVGVCLGAALAVSAVDRVSRKGFATGGIFRAPRGDAWGGYQPRPHRGRIPYPPMGPA